MSIVIPTNPYEIDKIIRSKGKDEIVSRECKHATYTVSDQGDRDALVVKEWYTFKDGLRLPTLTTMPNYKRPVWITKEPLRTHPEKIQFENMARCDMFKCRQMDLTRELYNRLRFGNPDWPVRKLARKPYVYGADQGPEVYLKQAFMDRWPGSFLPNEVTIFDVETDVWDEGYKPILWSEVNDKEVILYYNTYWTRDYPHYADDVIDGYRKTLPAYLDQIRQKLGKGGKYPSWIDDLEKLPVRAVAGDDGFDITEQMVQNLHLTQPDIVGGWNVFFDVGVIHDTCVRAGRSPQSILSDPRVPDDLRMAYLREGQKRRVTAAVRDIPLSPHERWHVMLHTASFRFSDSMQTYWQLRKAKGKENGGYGLDAVLTRQIGVGKVKLKSDQVDVPSGTLHWHMDMQKRFKVEYGVYSLFDSVGLKAFELKNSDLTSQVSSLAGAVDYSQFNSQPKINAADMHFFAMKHRKMVIATTSDEMETELDQKLYDRSDWIVTFPSHQVQDVGLHLFSDMPNVQSTVYMFGADVDVETTYPTAEIIQNLGKEQTEAEPCVIHGLDVEVQRRQCINVTGGRVNAIEIMQKICGMASLDEWTDHIQKRYFEKEVM